MRASFSFEKLFDPRIYNQSLILPDLGQFHKLARFSEDINKKLNAENNPLRLSENNRMVGFQCESSNSKIHIRETTEPPR